MCMTLPESCRPHRASQSFFGYDNNGNTLTKVTGSNTTSYTWDFENRLTSVTLPGSGGTVSFKYDAFGRRIYKSSSSATSIYAYDGDDLIEEVNSSGGVVARYSLGPAVDEPLAMLRSSTTSYFHADGIGSTTSLSNTAGSLAQTYTYDSFGKLTASSGSLTNPFQYTGRESDSETSLYSYRARYFDPQVGRFLSEDPVGFWGGANFYAYVKNNPVKYTDMFGLAPAPAPKCSPCDEQNDIRKAINNANQRLDALEQTGTAVLPGGASMNKPCAVTTCQVMKVRGTDITLAVVPDTSWTGQCKVSPCVRHCLDVHEGVHRRMCQKLGATFGTLNEFQMEHPAYMTELGCYIKTLQDAGLKP
jgi:RHS repeat-associated protein